jgi:hypothetical protein
LRPRAWSAARKPLSWPAPSLQFDQIRADLAELVDEVHNRNPIPVRGSVSRIDHVGIALRKS